MVVTWFYFFVFDIANPWIEVYNNDKSLPLHWLGFNDMNLEYVKSATWKLLLHEKEKRRTLH